MSNGRRHRANAAIGLRSLDEVDLPARRGSPGDPRGPVYGRRSHTSPSMGDLMPLARKRTLARADVQKWYPRGIAGFQGRPGDVIPPYAGNKV